MRTVRAATEIVTHIQQMEVWLIVFLCILMNWREMSAAFHHEWCQKLDSSVSKTTTKISN